MAEATGESRPIECSKCRKVDAVDVYQSGVGREPRAEWYRLPPGWSQQFDCRPGLVLNSLYVRCPECSEWWPEGWSAPPDYERLLQETFEKCQGLVRYSTGESDVYWELAEALLEGFARSRGLPIVRKEEA